MTIPRAKRRCAQSDCRNYHPCPKHPWGWQGAKSDHSLPTDWNSRKTYVKGRSHGRCEYEEYYGPMKKRCNRRGDSVDHIINRAEWPRGKPGVHDISNLQHLCNFHHDMKTRQESQRGILRRFKKE